MFVKSRFLTYIPNFQVKRHLFSLRSSNFAFPSPLISLTCHMYEGSVLQREEWQDTEKAAYIQSYLEQQTKDTDTQSFTTETSDSGITRSHGASSEFGIEEPSGKIILS